MYAFSWALVPTSVTGRWRACTKAGLLAHLLAGCASACNAQQGADASLVARNRSRAIGRWTGMYKWACSSLGPKPYRGQLLGQPFP